MFWAEHPGGHIVPGALTGRSNTCAEVGENGKQDHEHLKEDKDRKRENRAPTREFLSFSFRNNSSEKKLFSILDLKELVERQNFSTQVFKRSVNGNAWATLKADSGETFLTSVKALGSW
ncbi:hypothetical protein QTO34_003465 [Cnephaeus nilssonii]|uniref:Uncharacterized protein n=1 Tax=Cnephaeus nilssonii TaxID=3371016 RepID=A0AA40LKL6_CNENI|nr:hypothetical protein QTO34_003465 [Eptesicus nilssonii]